MGNCVSEQLLLFLRSVLLGGVLGLVYNREKEDIPAEILALVEERAAAKKAKDYARADAIRAELTQKGHVVEDTPKGPQVRRAK